VDYSGTYAHGITLTNYPANNPVTFSGTIQRAVEIVGSLYPWTVINSATLSGISLAAGGYVTNTASGALAGGFYYAAVDISGAVGTVTNNGRIGFEVGIVLNAGGTITNSSSGTISTLYGGFLISGGIGRVVNYGTIDGGIGGSGLSSGGTVVNGGTIGIGQFPLFFTGTQSNRLIMMAGGVVDRLRPSYRYSPPLVQAGLLASNALELAAGTGTIDAIGQSFVNFGTIQVDADADWTLTGSNTITNSETLANAGTIVVDGSLLLSGLLTGNGTIATQAGVSNRITVTFYGGLIESDGLDTITAGSVTVNVLAQGVGSLFFSAGTGSSTVSGGSGVGSLFGGHGTALFAAPAGGSSLLVAGSGNSTLIANGAGDQLFGGSGQTTSFGAISAVAFLIGGSGTSVLVGSVAATKFIGGSGQTFIYGGPGNDTIYAGSGQTHATLGGGTDAVLIQTGSGSFLDGAGADFYAMVNGAAGGSVTISGFKVGTDQVGLFGYGANPIAANQIVSGSTVLTFTDGTRLTLAGIINPGNSVT